MGLLQAADEITLEITPEGLASPAEPVFPPKPPHPSAEMWHWDTWKQQPAKQLFPAGWMQDTCLRGVQGRVTVTGRDWKPLELLHPSGWSLNKEVSG